MRIIMLMAAEAKRGQPSLRGRAPLPLWHVKHFEAKLDILDGRAPGQQAVVLEHDGDLAAKPVEFTEGIPPRYLHPAFARLQEPGDHVEHGGLAAAGLAKHRDQLAGADIEAEIIDGAESVSAAGAAEDFRHVDEADFCRGHRGRRRETSIDHAHRPRSDTAR